MLHLFMMRAFNRSALSDVQGSFPPELHASGARCRHEGASGRSWHGCTRCCPHGLWQKSLCQPRPKKTCFQLISSVNYHQSDIVPVTCSSWPQRRRISCWGVSQRRLWRRHSVSGRTRPQVSLRQSLRTSSWLVWGKHKSDCYYEQLWRSLQLIGCDCCCLFIAAYQETLSIDIGISVQSEGNDTCAIRFPNFFGRMRKEIPSSNRA